MHNSCTYLCSTLSNVSRFQFDKMAPAAKRAVACSTCRCDKYFSGSFFIFCMMHPQLLACIWFSRFLRATEFSLRYLLGSTVFSLKALFPNSVIFNVVTISVGEQLLRNLLRFMYLPFEILNIRITTARIRQNAIGEG